MVEAALRAWTPSRRERLDEVSYVRAAWALIVGTLLLRIIASGVLGLDFMESYGVVVARVPSLSYFDQPPLTWWLIGATTRLFGTEAAVVVRLPFILIFAASTWLLFRIAERLFTRRAALFGIAAFSCAPLFGIYDGGLAQTDCLTEFFVLLAARYLVAILFGPTLAPAASWSRWIGVGLSFGLALAAKYTAVLLLPGFALYLATSGAARRRWLLMPQPYVAALAALVPLTPVLIWNAQHHWVSFLYQGGRAAWGDGVHAARAARWLVTQVVILQPWIYLVMLAALVRGFVDGPKRQAGWFLCCTSLVPLVLFPAVMLWSSHPLRGYHWGSIGYLLAFPLVGAMIDRLVNTRPMLAKIWTVLIAAGYLVTLVGLVSHALTGWVAALAPVKMFRRQDPILLELFDWGDLPKALRARGIDPATTFVTATRWEECAKAAYALKTSYRLLCLADDNIHFSFIADPTRFAGQDAIVVDRYASLSAIKHDLEGHFIAIEELPPVGLTSFGRHLTDLKAYRARLFDGTWVVARPDAKPRQ